MQCEKDSEKASTAVPQSLLLLRRQTFEIRHRTISRPRPNPQSRCEENGEHVNPVISELVI